MNADVYVNANGDLLGYNMYAYCSNNPVMGRDPNGYVSWWGVAAGALIATAGIAIAALSYGVGSPIGAAMVFEGGALIAGTGLFTIGCAIEEQAMVLDLSVSDNGGNKSGASLVVDFAGETMDLYSHAGKSAGTDSGPSVSYAVGLVFNYTKPGDYGGPFVDAGGGINGWGVDYCRSPDLNPESCYAISATRSWPPSNGANLYAGFDQYIQVGSWGW